MSCYSYRTYPPTINQGEVPPIPDNFRNEYLAEQLNIKLDDLSCGVNVLPDNSVVVYFPKLRSDITEMSVTPLDNNGNPNAETEQLSIHSDGSSFTKLNIKHPFNYRLNITYADGTKVSAADPTAQFLPNGIRQRGDPLDYAASVKHDYTFRHHRVDYKEDARTSHVHIGIASKEGTISAITNDQFFERLKEAGTSTVLLLPSGAIEGRYNIGYDAVAYFNAPIGSHYGTPDELKKFVDLAHKHGMRIGLDFVVNHLSREIKSQQLLFGEDILTSDSTDWGQKPNFSRTGFRDFTVRSLENIIKNYNVDVIRLDAGWALPDDLVNELLSEATLLNPDISVIYEGYLLPNDTKNRFVEPLKTKLRDSGMSNEEIRSLEERKGEMLGLRCHCNGSFLNGVVVLYLPTQHYTKWMKQDCLNRSLGEMAWRQMCDHNRHSNFGINHDFYINIYPYSRLPQRLIEIHGPDMGLAALNSIMTIGNITPGNFVRTYGDEIAVYSNRFPFFRDSSEKQESNKVNQLRLRELNGCLVTDSNDLMILNIENMAHAEDHPWNGTEDHLLELVDQKVFVWDGSEEQLDILFNNGLLTEATYDALCRHMPTKEETFLAAKLHEDEYNTEISKLWRRIQKSSVDFTETITKRRLVMPRGENILTFENMREKSSGKGVVACANITKTVQDLTKSISGLYNFNQIIYNSSEELIKHNPSLAGTFAVKQDGDHIYLPPYSVIFIRED